MSPIIYTPHQCEKPSVELPGTLWQCSECGLIWELDSDTTETGKRLKWWAIERPRRDIALGAARARAAQTEMSTTPALPKLPAAAEAVLDAWRVPGRSPATHEAAKREVRKSFPYLAARLDEACDTRG